MKRFQNRTAVSGFTLPVMALYTLLVWLLSSTVQPIGWIQMVCVGLAAFLLVELSNSNALLRVRSRMVTSVFLALSCVYCPYLLSLSSCVLVLCMVSALLILFRTYQDNRRPGVCYYAFLCLGIGSIFFIQVFYLIPLVWLLMATQLQSLSLRTWLASLFGLLTPYWFMVPWLVWHQNYQWLLDHVMPLTEFDSAGIHTFTIGQVASYTVILLMALLGIGHFWLKSYEDKIRIRQLFGFFIVMILVVALWMMFQPQCFDQLMPLLILFTSPLIAHFFTFTESRVTNIFFIICIVLVVLLTALNLWELHLNS